MAHFAVSTAMWELQGELMVRLAGVGGISVTGLAGFLKAEAVGAGGAVTDFQLAGMPLEEGGKEAPFASVPQALRREGEATSRLGLFLALARLSPEERHDLELGEFSRLRDLWLAARGRLVSPDPVLEISQSGVVIVEGGLRLYSQLWGEIAPERLNRGLGFYAGTRGYVRLVRDLALVTDRMDLSTATLYRKLANVQGRKQAALLRSMNWNAVPIDWRRALYLERLLHDKGFRRAYAGPSGYGQFSLDYFKGISDRAYSSVAALLDGKVFASLEWGRMRKTNAEQEERLREELCSGLYDGMTGYALFSQRFCGGKPQKAYEIARSLLSDGHFAALGWAKMKKTRASHEEHLRAALLSGNYEGDEGYKRFSRAFFRGHNQSAYEHARSLLTDEEFELLGWSGVRPLLVNEEEELKAALLHGIENGTYVGVQGYKRFSLERFQGDLSKAYRVAKTLLREGFVVLGWGRMRKFRVAQQELFEEPLQRGEYKGLVGYRRFAENWCGGDLKQAYEMADVVMGEAFASLAWGKMRITNVRDEATLGEALRNVRYAGREGRIFFLCNHFDLLNTRSVDTAYRKTFLVAKSILQDDPAALKALGWTSTEQPTEEEVAFLKEWLRQREL